MATPKARRRKGEHGIDRHHSHPTCPPVGADGERPAHKCQGPYRARMWVDTPTGPKRKVLYGKTEREVLGKIKDTAVAEATGTVVATTTTVAQWAEHWLATGWDDWKVNTRTGYRSKVNLWITPYLGKHRLDKLQPEHVRSLYATMRKAGAAEGTVRGVHVLLHRMLKLAMWDGKVGRNVTELVVPPKTNTAVPARALTLDEAKRVLAAAGDNPRYWVSLMCGLRQGECLALRWYDVHLDAPQPYLTVRESLAREPGVGLVFQKPKSRASQDRMVPLPTPVAARLAVARAKHLAGEGSEDALVFGNSKGNPKEPSRDYEGWCALLAAAGVEHTPLHGARRTTAHLLEDAGVGDRVVAEILGHSAVAMTHHYQQRNNPATVKAMQALDAHLALPAPTDMEGAA